MQPMSMQGIFEIKLCISGFRAYESGFRAYEWKRYFETLIHSNDLKIVAIFLSRL